MANHDSAKKRIKQTAKKTIANNSIKSQMKTFFTKFENAVKDNKQDIAQELFNHTQSVIAKASKKNIIHKNKAARKVSKMHSLLKSM